jgi:hypothetical protein
MSFLDDFEDVLTQPDNALAIESPTETESPSVTMDYFDREDEPVIW